MPERRRTEFALFVGRSLDVFPRCRPVAVALYVQLFRVGAGHAIRWVPLRLPVAASATAAPKSA